MHHSAESRGFRRYELIAGTEVTTFGFQFHYHPIVKVTPLEPNFASTSGGDVVLVNGKNFIRRAELGEMPDKVSTFCAMGTTGYEEGHFISSALVACETVAFPQEADVAMEISLNREDKSGSKIALHLRHSPDLGGVNPVGAPAAGGTTITVRGDHFHEESYLGCKLGTIGPVAAMSLDDREALCVVPSHVPEAVPLAVSHNGHDVSPHAVRFHYRPPAVVDALFPEHGVSGGGTLVTITGAYFEQGEQAIVAWARGSSPPTPSPRASSCAFPLGAGVRARRRRRRRGGRHRGRKRAGAWFHYQAPAALRRRSPIGGVGGGAPFASRGTSSSPSSRTDCCATSARTIRRRRACCRPCWWCASPPHTKRARWRSR